MRARIFQPTKTATQSGRAQTNSWVLRFERASAMLVEPVMGWTGGDDMDQEVRLTFPTREAAVAYAEANEIAYSLPKSQGRVVRRRAYADNFAANRIEARSRPVR